jgi:8-oxo-dGTP pyrophosphatase MutT (NUDIX family)
VIPRPAAWRPGAPAPWSCLAPAPERIEVADLAGVVAARGEGAEPVVGLPDARRSAVLVALFSGDRGAEVVLTRRSKLMTNHRGEVSFPGGRMDEGEIPVETALREAHEEVDLDPAAVRVVGELDHLATMVTHSHIVPVVGTLEHLPPLRAATAEVARILTVPLVGLLDDGVYREERWGVPPLDRTVRFFELEDETVWGATAHMLTQLLSLATGVAQ